ncbi:heterokaryon incompatibility protein-domain-containing protein [Bisporella sp. PMI_857]|nr:heterokaryon incompatibility protein-domain-containing protein [Bisporella sp. PMI_857]
MRPTWVVDVWQQCLVGASSAHEYVALSYVWGGNLFIKTLRSNIDQLQVPLSLSLERNVEVPRSIRDAMNLTESMGKRYLWVDCLCIVQDDEIHKAEQIASMAAIFANASLTIIAASGENADAGLPGFPGISTPRSVQQQTFILNHGLKVVKLQRPDSPFWRVSQPWGRRAWTIQEHLFSKRRLVYEKGWIRWHCNKATWQEDCTTAQVDSIFPEKDIWDDLTDLRQECTRTIPNITALGNAIRHFVRADLTYPEDSLDAFAGVATALSPCYKDGFISGLPVAFFYIAVLWKPLWGICRRRSKKPDAQIKLPSWSWAGWKGDIETSSWAAAMDFLIASCRRFDDHPSLERVTPLFEWKYHEILTDTGKPIPNIWYESRQKFGYGKDSEPCPHGWTRHKFSESRFKHLDGEMKYLGSTPQHIYKHQSGPHSEFRYPLILPTETEAPILRQPVPYISCTTRRAYLYGDTVFQDRPGNDNILLRNQVGTWMGILTLHNLAHLDRNMTMSSISSRTLFELVEVARGRTRLDDPGDPQNFLCPEFSLKSQEMPTDGKFYEYYYVLWIEWDGDIAYRKGIGRVAKSRWEFEEGERINLMLG